MSYFWTQITELVSRFDSNTFCTHTEIWGSAAWALPRAEPKGVKVGRSNEPFLDDKGH